MAPVRSRCERPEGSGGEGATQHFRVAFCTAQGRRLDGSSKWVVGLLRLGSGCCGSTVGVSVLPSGHFAESSFETCDAETLFCCRVQSQQRYADFFFPRSQLPRAHSVSLMLRALDWSC